MNEQQQPDFILEETPGNSSPASGTLKSDFNFCNTKILSRILRSIGAIIIVAAASTLLFQHWTPGSDLQRYLLLLGFTSILSLGGLFCGLRLKESKGARTLLGLTLAVTPINFAIMGALLYSQFSWDGAFTRLPNYATWIAASPGMAILTTLGGVAVLAPLGHFSFMALGHNRAKLLSVSFTLSNLTMLLPTRQPNLIAGVFLLLIAALTTIDIRYFRQETSLNTFEGRLSRSMLWVPALILIGRASYFYTPSQLFVSAILSSAALLSFIFLPQLINSRRGQHVLQICGALLASSAWVSLAELLDRALHINNRWSILLLCLPIAGLLILLSKYSVGSGSNYRRTAAIVAILGATANLLIFNGLQSSLLCLLISFSVLVYGYLIEQKFIFFSGAGGALLGLGYQLKTALSHFSLTGWSSLMVIGVLIIIAASLLERNGGQLRDKLLLIRTRLNQWNN